MKVLFLAVVIVLIIGLGLTGGLYYVFNIQYRTPTSQLYSASLRPVTSEPVSLTLNLTSPDDDTLSFEGDILVSGKTSTGGTVIMDLNGDYSALETKPNGDFSATLKLQNGINNLILIAFDNLGNSKTEKRAIYYSTEKI